MGIVVSQNQYIDLTGECLVDVYNYEVVNDLINGGLNAVELKGYHKTLGEHLIIWTLDNENIFEYIIATPKDLIPNKKEKLTSDVRNLVNSILNDYLEMFPY